MEKFRQDLIKAIDEINREYNEDLTIQELEAKLGKNLTPKTVSSFQLDFVVGGAGTFNTSLTATVLSLALMTGCIEPKQDPQLYPSKSNNKGPAAQKQNVKKAADERKEKKIDEQLKFDAEKDQERINQEEENKKLQEQHEKEIQEQLKKERLELETRNKKKITLDELKDKFSEIKGNLNSTLTSKGKKTGDILSQTTQDTNIDSILQEGNGNIEKVDNNQKKADKKKENQTQKGKSNKGQKFKKKVGHRDKKASKGFNENLKFTNYKY